MRYPDLKSEEMSSRQREVAAALLKGADGKVSAQYEALLYSPEIAQRVQLLGDFLRHNLRLPERLRVLAVLVTARRHRVSDMDHFLQLDATQHARLPDATIASLRDGVRPSAMKDDESLVYDFSTELMRTGHVRSEIFEQAVRLFGREICLELVEVCGYTAFLITILNVTQRSIANDGG